MSHTLTELVMGVIPIATEETRGFWEATMSQQLAAQRCDDCGHLQLPPGPCCVRCLSQGLSWSPLSGLGRVFSFTIVRHPFHPTFAGSIPYVLADIVLDEGPIIASNITDIPVEDVRIGMPVGVWFDEPVEDAFHFRLRLPKFRPAEAS